MYGQPGGVPPYAQQSKPRKSHKRIIIAAIVVVLTLLVGGLVWWLIGKSSHSDGADALPIPSDQWEDGLDELWNTEIDAGEEDFLYTTDEYMVLIDVPATYDDDSDTYGTAQLTSWGIGGDQPEQLASVTIDHASLQSYTIFGTRLVATGTANDSSAAQSYDILTGEEEEVPWSEGDTVTVAGNSVAIACSGGTCAGYDTELDQIWKEEIDPEVAAYMTVSGGIIQSAGNVKGISCYEGPCKVLDLTTGKTTDSEFEPPTFDAYPAKYYAFAFRDGWAIQYLDDYSEYGQAFVSQDGKLIADVSADDFMIPSTIFQISNGGFQTVEDVQQMLSGTAKASGDHTTMTGTGDECDKITINDEAVIDDDFYMWAAYGDQCEVEGMPLLSSSDQGKVLTIGPDLRAGFDNDIVALLSTERGEYLWKSELASSYMPSSTDPDALAKLSFGRLVSSDKLLTIDVDTHNGTSQVTAYKPK